MDKYIKMLVIKLSQKYKVTITSIMSYNDEKNCLTNLFKLKITTKGEEKKILCLFDCHNKRDLISELMKWQK